MLQNTDQRKFPKAALLGGSDCDFSNPEDREKLIHHFSQLTKQDLSSIEAEFVAAGIVPRYGNKEFVFQSIVGLLMEQEFVHLSNSWANPIISQIPTICYCLNPTLDLNSLVLLSDEIQLRYESFQTWIFYLEKKDGKTSLLGLLLDGTFQFKIADLSNNAIERLKKQVDESWKHDQDHLVIKL